MRCFCANLYFVNLDVPLVCFSSRTKKHNNNTTVKMGLCCGSTRFVVVEEDQDENENVNASTYFAAYNVTSAVLWIVFIIIIIIGIGDSRVAFAIFWIFLVFLLVMTFGGACWSYKRYRLVKKRKPNKKSKSREQEDEDDDDRS